jgi:predicted ATPase
MLSALLGDDEKLTPLKHLILERTQGIPFFMEEMVQALFEDRVLQRNGFVTLAKPISVVRVPATVQAVLASRIDRLPPVEKELLQTLAVLGREFSLTLVESVAGKSNDELEQMLSHLRLSEFINEQPTVGDVEYSFKHALTRQVAYDSILAERRKALHEQAGEAIERLFDDRLNDHVFDLARHYERGGNLPKAVEYLGRAGQQAMQRSAHGDAVSNLTEAIRLLERLPPTKESLQQELGLQLTVGSAYIAIRGWGSPEAERAYARARELSERVGDVPELFPSLFGLWAIDNARGNIRSSYPIAQQLLRWAQTSNDTVLMMYANIAMGNVSLDRGELALTKKHVEQALAAYDREQHHQLAARYAGLDAGIWALLLAGLLLLRMGYLDRAVDKAKQMLALARELRDTRSRSFAEVCLGLVHWLRGEPNAALQPAETAIALSADQDSDTLAIALAVRGLVIAEQGRGEEGVAQIREGVSKLRTTGSEVNLPMILCMLAEVCLKSGCLDEASNALTDAQAIADKNGTRPADHAEIRRLKGELLLRRDGPNIADAKSCFEWAVQKARKHDAKLWELRASVSLARLLVSHDHRDEARTTIADIYNWFTEGFDTRDLQEAKQLLNELDQES